jgi:hypothetical protein
MGEILFIGVCCQIIWRPSLFPIGSLEKLMIPIGLLFQLQYDFLVGKSFCIGWPERNVEMFWHRLIMFCLYWEIC